MADNDEPLFINPALLRRAEWLNRQRLENDPDNLGALRSLAQVCRKLGNLEGAAAAYKRLFQLDSEDQEAGYMDAIFCGKECRTAPSGMRAAPFAVLKDFLPRSFHDSLLALLISLREQDKLAPARLGDGHYNPNHRETLDFMGKWDGRERFKDHFREILSQIIPRLFPTPCEIKGMEAYLRAYLDGHFFKVHMDSPPNSPRGDRVISFVYYFHKLPRPYTGGELLLFDSDLEVSGKFTTACFTCIVPEDNSLVVFPSKCYHCVLPVRCPSQEFADSRFVINGFVHRRTEIQTGAVG